MLTAEDLHQAGVGTRAALAAAEGGPFRAASPARTIATGIATMAFLQACAMGATAALIRAPLGRADRYPGRRA
jgi:hypothetical protein